MPSMHLAQREQPRSQGASAFGEFSLEVDGQSRVDHHIAGGEVYPGSALAEPEATELSQHSTGDREEGEPIRGKQR